MIESFPFVELWFLDNGQPHKTDKMESALSLSVNLYEVVFEFVKILYVVSIVTA